MKGDRGGEFGCERDGLGIGGVDDEMEGVSGQRGSRPSARDGGTVEAVASNISERTGCGERFDRLVLTEAFADFGGRTGDVDLDQFVIGGKVTRDDGVPRAGQYGKVSRSPKGGPFFPSAVDERFAGGSALNEVCADNMPNLAIGFETGLKLMIAGERVLFEVEEVDGDAGEVGEGDIGECSAVDRGYLIGAGFVGARTAGDDVNLIERKRESFSDEPMMKAGRIETSSKESDARCHVPHGARWRGDGQMNFLREN